MILIRRKFENKFQKIEKKMEKMVMEVNQSHLKDLKLVFDETKKLKNILNLVFEKIEQVTKNIEKNSESLDVVGCRLDGSQQGTILLTSKITQIEEEMLQ